MEGGKQRGRDDIPPVFIASFCSLSHAAAWRRVCAGTQLASSSLRVTAARGGAPPGR